MASRIDHYKITIYLSLGLHTEHPRGFQRTSNTSKHEFFSFFLLLRVIFALLDPDPLESGSNTDPQPPCLEASHLLLPATAACPWRRDMETPVRLMTRSGDVVLLPHDLRVPFARLLARLPPAPATNLHLKRYTFGRVVKEKKVFGLHPKELTECAFDIVSVPAGRVLADAELLLVCQEVVQAGLAIKPTHPKNTPKKNHLKKPTKNVFLGFIFGFFKFLIFYENNTNFSL
jgi:hypothetical protein